MGIKKPIKLDISILLNARKLVVITFILLIVYIFGSLFLLSYKLISFEVFSTKSSIICYPILITHAFLCGRLYNVISKNIITSSAVGILILVLSRFALGIGTYILTIYLLVKSNTALKLSLIHI